MDEPMRIRDPEAYKRKLKEMKRRSAGGDRLGKPPQQEKPVKKGSQEPCSKCDSDDKEHYCHGCGRCSDCCPDWEGHGRGGYMESTDAALDKAFRTGWAVVKADEPFAKCPNCGETYTSNEMDQMDAIAEEKGVGTKCVCGENAGRFTGSMNR